MSIYLDNAATTMHKPQCVIDAVVSAMQHMGNSGRGAHDASLDASRTIFGARERISDLMNLGNPKQVAFTSNSTEALNTAILGLFGPGDHIISTVMEHNSVLRPLEHLKKQGIITYDVCPLSGEPIGGNGYLDLQVLKSLLRPNTKMVIVTTASNVTGYAPPLEKLRSVIPPNVLLLCDGAQGGGHFPMNMQKNGIDFLAIAGHKGMLGIQGSGALLFSERVNPRPSLYGGTGSISISLDMPDFYPDGLEAGTLSYPAVVSLLEGTRYLSLHLKRLQPRVQALTGYFLRGLEKLPAYTPYSTPNPCGIVAFKHKALQSEQIADLLSSKYDIAVRGGLHCAPLAHEAFTTLDGGLVRVSFSHFNSEREIDLLLSALREIDNR